MQFDRNCDKTPENNFISYWLEDSTLFQGFYLTMDKYFLVLLNNTHKVHVN